MKKTFLQAGAHQNRIMRVALFALLVSSCSVFAEVASGDWPQFLGPHRNGTYQGPALTAIWPKDGPPKVWQIRVGQGFAGPIALGNRLILFHRMGDEEIVQSLEASTGKAEWTFKYPTAYRDDFGFDEGPRATPAIDDDRVYTFGAEGKLHCVDLKTGNRIWMVDCKKQFQAGKGFFGMACSPLVEGELVSVNVGGANGAGIVAFDKKTGAVKWKSTSHEASYSSPVAGTIGGHRELFYFTRNGLVILEPSSGKILSEFPWRSRTHASVNAATPLLVENKLFLSASYETGGVLLDISKLPPKQLWAGDDILSSHYATPVEFDGFLYGYDGRQEQQPALVCVDLKTGKAKWREENFGAGTITLTGKTLFLMTDNGELVTAAADPAKLRILARAQIMPRGVRAYPAFAQGKLFVRSKDQLGSFDLANR